MWRRGVRLIATMLRREPLVFGVSMAGAAAFAVGLVITSIALGRITDQVILPTFADGRPRIGTVMVAGLTIIGIVLVRSIGVVLRRYFGAMGGRRNQRRMRGDIAEQYLGVPLDYQRSRSTGELLAHADADVEVATEALFPLPFGSSIVVLLATSLISIIAVDPVLALVAVAVFPVLAYVNQFYSSRVEDPAADVQANVGRVSTIAHESFDGALVVKTLGREQAEIDRMAAASERLRQSRLAVGRLRATFEPSIDFIPNAGTIALVALGGWRVSTGAITTGEIVQVVSLFGMLGFPVRVLGFLFEELPRSVVAYERIENLLAIPHGPHTESEADPGELPDEPLRVEFDRVSFDHDGQTVLDGFNVDIAAGETVALVGHTGSGKSTICNLVARLTDPNAGQVRVGGHDLTTISADAVGERVAYVFQESFLFASPVIDNITLGQGFTEAEVREAAGKARAHQFISELPKGYDTIVGERGVTLSGGQRQRVALARALIRKPRLLLVDDATSAVDPIVEAEILEALRREKTTMIIVAHRRATIALADRVLFLDGGRLAASGTHDELMAIPSYAALAQAYDQERDDG